jgi:hypothetical protein
MAPTYHGDKKLKVLSFFSVPMFDECKNLQNPPAAGGFFYYHFFKSFRIKNTVHKGHYGYNRDMDCFVTLAMTAKGLMRWPLY